MQAALEFAASRCQLPGLPLAAPCQRCLCIHGAA